MYDPPSFKLARGLKGMELTPIKKTMAAMFNEVLAETLVGSKPVVTSDGEKYITRFLVDGQIIKVWSDEDAKLVVGQKVVLLQMKFEDGGTAYKLVQ